MTCNTCTAYYFILYTACICYRSVLLSGEICLTLVDSEFPLSPNPNSWIISVSRVHTVLKSPWILAEVFEKSLNSSFPWKVLEFSSNLNVVRWKEFSDAFLLSNNNNNNGIYIALIHHCSRQNVNHSSENLKVIYLKCFVICNN